MANVRAVEVESRPGVFRPTTTTTELIRCVSQYISKPGRMLDLGCGGGVVGATLFKQGKVEGSLCASDISADAVSLCRSNCSRLAIPIDARVGSVYAPWHGETFDYIVDDVSGVAKEVASLSPWFDGVPCESGEDGTKLVVEAIVSAPEHLKPGGRFFFPAVSLSDVAKIVECAAEVFETVTPLSTIDWPMPLEMKPHERRLRELRESGLIQFDEKFGYLIMSTSIYVGQIN